MVKYGLERGNKQIKLAEDELMHWKYITRSKGRDGRWRYVYSNKNNTLTQLRNESKTAGQAGGVSASVNANKEYKKHINTIEGHIDALMEKKGSQIANGMNFVTHLFDKTNAGADAGPKAHGKVRKEHNFNVRDAAFNYFRKR